MSGTKIGGLKAYKSNTERYGKDYYREIGRKGGKNGHTGGFAANPELARIAGAKGGRNGKRGAAKLHKYSVVFKKGDDHRAYGEVIRVKARPENPMIMTILAKKLGDRYNKFINIVDYVEVKG